MVCLPSFHDQQQDFAITNKYRVAITQFRWVYGNLHLSQLTTYVVFVMWNKDAVSKWQLSNPSEPVYVDVHYMGIWII